MPSESYCQPLIDRCPVRQVVKHVVKGDGSPPNSILGSSSTSDALVNSGDVSSTALQTAAPNTPQPHATIESAGIPLEVNLTDLISRLSGSPGNASSDDVLVPASEVH